MGKSFKGDAIVTTITADIAAGDLTILIAANGGWPSGAGGKPFVVELRAADDSAHEKVLVASRSGSTLNVATRGYDDTVAASFVTGASIRHVWDAVSAQDGADHLEATGNPHPDSDLMTPVEHDVTARHTFSGGSLLAGGTPAPVVATGSVGSGEAVAKANHAHALDPSVAGAGLGMTAGVLELKVDDSTLAISGDSALIKDGGVGTAKLAAQSVTTAKIAPDNITSALIADDQIDSEHIVDGAVDPVHLAASLPRGMMGIANRTSDSSDFGAESTVPSFTVTATPVSSSRHVRVKVNLVVSYDIVAAGVDGAIRVKILEGATEIYEAVFHLLTQTTFYGVDVERVYTPTAGAKTWTVKVAPAGNADTVKLQASAAKPCQLYVEDIGGS